MLAVTFVRICVTILIVYKLLLLLLLVNNRNNRTLYEILTETVEFNLNLTKITSLKIIYKLLSIY